MPYQLHRYVDYVEVRLEGVIESALKYEDVAEVAGTAFTRLLVDFTDVTEVRADAYSLADQARKDEALGVKIALYAPRPALFGLARQVLQLGHVHEGVSASVFNDIEEARAWLTAG